MSTTLDDNFEVRTGIDSVVARVVFRIQFALGEWFLRPGRGIPYTDDVFSSRQASGAIDVVRRYVREVSDVTDVEVVVRSLTSLRTLELEVRLETIYGSAVTTVEVG